MFSHPQVHFWLVRCFPIYRKIRGKIHHGFMDGSIIKRFYIDPCYIEQKRHTGIICSNCWTKVTTPTKNINKLQKLSLKLNLWGKLWDVTRETLGVMASNFYSLKTNKYRKKIKSIVVQILPKITARWRLSNIQTENWKFEFYVKNLVKMKGVLHYVA